MASKDWLQKKIDQIHNKKCAEVLTLCSKTVHDFALDILVQEILDLQATASAASRSRQP